MLLPDFEIRPARTATDVAEAVRLFRAYAASLVVDLAYQGFEAEMAAMPGKYAPPAGELLLAWKRAGEAVGCVALRPLDPPGCCEMKRLYVAPGGRGGGLGRALVDAIVTRAQAIGYAEMRLDTLPSMAAAQGLYRRFGFEPMAPYYETPLTETLFFRRVLSPGISAGR